MKARLALFLAVSLFVACGGNVVAGGLGGASSSGGDAGANPGVGGISNVGGGNVTTNVGAGGFGGGVVVSSVGGGGFAGGSVGIASSVAATTGASTSGIPIPDGGLCEDAGLGYIAPFAYKACTTAAGCVLETLPYRNCCQQSIVIGVNPTYANAYLDGWEHICHLPTGPACNCIAPPITEDGKTGVPAVQCVAGQCSSFVP